MKIKTLGLPALLVFAALACGGCVHSHRAVYYTPAPGVVATSPVVVAPTSGRPVERVYPGGPPAVVPPSTPPPDVDTADVALATSVSQTLKADRSIADATRNVEATVSHGTVTLRGTVPTDHDRDEIVERISHLPGVGHVHDQLGVELR